MSSVTYTYAAASCSWIDKKTGLPEVDENPINNKTTTLSALKGNRHFRFSNFVNVWATIDDSRRTISQAGFGADSGLYRALSYARIPSHVFPKLQKIVPKADHVSFIQTVGARTVSPERIAESAGFVGGMAAGAGGGFLVAGPPGALVCLIAGAIVGDKGAETAAHHLMGFPPIWSTIEIRIFNSGRADARLIAHSIFPSLTYYEQDRDENGTPMTTLFNRVPYSGISTYYDATKDMQLPHWKESGWGPIQNSHLFATPGNPWNYEKGFFPGDGSEPTE